MTIVIARLAVALVCSYMQSAYAVVCNGFPKSNRSARAPRAHCHANDPAPTAFSANVSPDRPEGRHPSTGVVAHVNPGVAVTSGVGVTAGVSVAVAVAVGSGV